MSKEQDGYVLAVDCGTQSLRTIVFDKKGNLIAKVKEDFEPYFSTEPGFAEQSPELYWDTLVSCMNKLHLQGKELMDRIEAITVTTLRGTGVFLDKDGEIVRPSIIWLDQREAKCEKKLSIKTQMMFKATGMERAAACSRKICKVNWIKENEKETWEKTAHYLLLPGYFHYKLTGKLVDTTSNQVGHIPYDYKLRQWPKSEKAYQYELFPIEKSKLPELVEPGTIIGCLTTEASAALGLPHATIVIANGSDKGCETLGVGCMSPDSVSLSFGTTATIQTTTKQYLEPIPFMPSYCSAVPNLFTPEVQVFRGYWMIRWFKQEFAHKEMLEAISLDLPPEVLLNERLSDIPPGSEGLLLQPFWAPDLKNPEAKGSIIGFSDVHKRSHIYRAIIEGINFALMDGLEKIEHATKVHVKDIYVSGGGSQSDAICQITADMFGRKVIKGETYEAAGLGAAINSFVTLKYYETYPEAIQNMVRHSQVFLPDEKNAKIYKGLYEKVYKKIYGKLKDLYREIEKITKPQSKHNE